VMVWWASDRTLGCEVGGGMLSTTKRKEERHPQGGNNSDNIGQQTSRGCRIIPQMTRFSHLPKQPRREPISQPKGVEEKKDIWNDK